MSVSSRTRRIIGALAVVGALALAVPALSVTAASAGTDPGVPSQSQLAHHHGLRPQFFYIREVNNYNGTVYAAGPIRGFGIDPQPPPSNTLDIFVFARGTVNVHHTDVSNVNPQINYLSCTAFASADGYWAVLGGTGKYRNAFGYGWFHFTLYLVFKKHHHQCSINQNTQPVYSLVQVWAYGKATAGYR